MASSLDIRQTLQQEPHVFIQPSAQLYSEFVQLAKSYLDPLAGSVVQTQSERQKAERQTRKRKRRGDDVDGESTRQEVLRLKQVHVDGFDVRQVWQQANRVLGAGADEVEKGLDDIAEDDLSDEDGSLRQRNVRFRDEIDSSIGSVNDEGIEEDDIVDEDGLSEDEAGGVPLDGIKGEATDEDSQDMGNETPPSEFSDHRDTGEVLVNDKHGLNDGFFNIDQFNKQTQFLEQVDARGDSDDGAASDEEDVDWTVDPLSYDPQPGATRDKQPSRNVDRKGLVGQSDEDENEFDEDEEEDDDDEGGPTFGNMDLNAPEGDSDVEDEDQGDEDEILDDAGLNNTNNVMYGDFFAPPARKTKAKARQQNGRKSHQSSSLAVEPNRGDIEEEELERTMSAVHRDLFDDDLSDNADEGANEIKNGNNSNLSSHERRQLALRAEIRRLEAENVASKHWSLAGETLAPSRPLNSLLEEDLDFERTGKPVPVITEEVSEDIENLIKRRILGREFDEVIRRHPNDLLAGSADPRRRGRADLELSTSKHDKGLAEEYADDHLRVSDPAYVDKRTTALRATHKAIEDQWASVSAQLDGLCNWHYKPKPPAPSLEVRVDTPAITLEDARPTGVAGDMGEGTMLAPQEVWRKTMDGRADGEVVTKGGASYAKEELSREQKKRRRSREKERVKKAIGNNGSDSTHAVSSAQTNGSRNNNHKTARKRDQADMVSQLQKGGVRVIDKKGTVREIDGQKARHKGSNVASAGQFKL